MRATFTSTLDHTMISTFDAASYYVRSIQTGVVSLTNPLFLEHLQDAYNSKPGCSYHGPGLLSHSWRLALHMSSSDPDDILNYEGADPESHPFGEAHFLRAILLFCRYMRYLNLADHVDVALFFDLVIHSHLDRGFEGDWQFAYCLLVVCLQDIDTSASLTFSSFWSPSQGTGRGLDDVYRHACRHMRLFFSTPNSVLAHTVLWGHICEHRGCDNMSWFQYDTWDDLDESPGFLCPKSAQTFAIFPPFFGPPKFRGENTRKSD